MICSGPGSEVGLQTRLSGPTGSACGTTLQLPWHSPIGVAQRSVHFLPRIDLVLRFIRVVDPSRQALSWSCQYMSLISAMANPRAAGTAVKSSFALRTSRAFCPKGCGLRSVCPHWSLGGLISREAANGATPQGDSLWVAASFFAPLRGTNPPCIRLPATVQSNGTLTIWATRPPALNFALSPTNLSSKCGYADDDIAGQRADHERSGMAPPLVHPPPAELTMPSESSRLFRFRKWSSR